MEQKILLYFLNNPNIVLTKKMILKEVWGSEFLSESTLTVHIASLRSKVETNPRKPSLIKTVWGEGYRLDFRSYEPVELDHEITTNDIDSLSDFERKANIICAQLNNYIDLKPTLETIVKQIRDELVDCNAMGIRLYNNGDYPYYVHSGFSKEFIEIENSLCVKDENGNWILTKDEKGYILDCMCGNIIRRNFDASLPFFTEQGSYWSNNTSTLLMKNGVNVIHDSKRGQCSSCRYESVALIPISINGECIGLIQLNDHRIGMFTENLIDCLQMIGEHIGMAIYNSMEYSNSKMYNLELLDENRKLKNRLEHITKLITTI